MPLGPGGYDSNGIWLYGEDDSEALASDLLNLGMQSVSDALGAGFGKILQVVSGTKTDSFSASLTNGAITTVTGLSATITPSSASSKVLVLLDLSGAGDDTDVFSTIVKRGGTEIGLGDAAGSRTRVTSGGPASSGSNGFSSSPAIVLDSPASTSPLTYTVDIHNNDNATVTVFVNRSPSDGNAARNSRSSSTIILMEVAA